MEDPQPSSDLVTLIGKTALVGITRVDHEGTVVRQDQFHGNVESLEGGLVHIRVASSGADFTLPPDASVFTKARPGHYRLQATGEVVIDPDFTSSWTIHAPSANGHPQNGEI